MSEKYEEMMKRFPHLYADRDAPMTQTCMCWGIECGPGWYDLLYELSAKLEALILKMPLEAQEHVKASQVKEKCGCYDEETEILTDTGWKFFRDLITTDKVACLRNGTHLIYKSPTDIISYFYEGPMYRLQTRGVDLLVTPNHNLYVGRPPKINGHKRGAVKYTHYPLELTTYDKYLGKNKVFKKGAIWVGEELSTFTLPGIEWTSKYKNKHKVGSRQYSKLALTLDMNAWLNFLGWYVAEGCCNKNEILIAYNTKNKEEEGKIVNAVRAIGFHPTIYKNNNTIRFCSKQIAQWLVGNCGHLAPNKRVPTFIQQLTPCQIQVFIESLYEGDGHKERTSHILCTTSKVLADQVQELLLKIGEVGHIIKREPGQYTSATKVYQGHSITSRHTTYYINRLKKTLHESQAHGLAKSSSEKMEEYKGKVYCVSVPEHVIYVRRNGKPVWCGNSLRFYMTSGTDEMDKLISEAEDKSERTCEDCGQPGKNGALLGWWRTRCYDCYMAELVYHYSSRLELLVHRGIAISQEDWNRYKGIQPPWSK